MAKLTDKQHKRMIARYAECQSYSQVAREFKVSKMTVKRHVDGDKESLQKVTQKKEENTLDMLSFMDAKKNKAQDLVMHILEALDSPEKLARSNVRDLATALGIIVDKFTQNVPQQTQGSSELLKEIRDGIREGQAYVE